MSDNEQMKGWDAYLSSRPLTMPNGVKRLVRLPLWAWDIYADYTDLDMKRIVSLNWTRALQFERPEAFDYIMTSDAHSKSRRYQKMAYVYDLLGKDNMRELAEFPANDFHDPCTLPTFPDPWPHEAHCLLWMKKRIQARFPKPA
ncbi:hypothetical protein ACFSSA_13480 [Luteolibacter algae]|uniref:Uncharacterized protein n=1 Tax=Luteolibacter algae TaxID=454151 RepID=A0ABW5DA84_9BACT